MSGNGSWALAAGHVFDGAQLHESAVVVLDRSRIVALLPRSELPRDVMVRELPEGVWLAPGFIDLQVNGGADILFNELPTPTAISSIAAAHRRFGTTGLLPTLISDTTEKMQAALDAVQAVIHAEPGILGIHLEGPFLSPEKAGIHDARVLRSPTREDEELLCLPRKGKTVLTLAPEQVPPGFIGRLAKRGIRLSLGHSMATYAQTKAAVADGVTGFTHLFNAMRPLAAREPGPIAAALESPELWYGLIVDGVHVDPAMLRLALRGAGRPMLVTDAMPPVGGNRLSFTLYGREITVREGRCTSAEGTLAGAVLDMASAVRNCVELVGVPLTAALRFASAHPASFLGLDHVLGRLAPGYRADMVAFEPRRLDVLATWVAGSEGRPQTEGGALARCVRPA
jgi:N-acetylglucosamine-6-phosphate deacetylase